MASVELVLLHGWALDASFWSEWSHVAEAIAPNTRLTALERGYFGSAQTDPRFSQSASTRVLVTHSFGLHLAPEELFEKADLLVIISGFAHFHCGSDKEARVSQIAIRKMLQKLNQEPTQVLKDFYRNCALPDGYGIDQISQPKKIQIELLRADLELLNSSTVNSEWLSRPRDVLLLHGQRDKIAPAQHVEDLKNIRPDARVSIHADASHALPYENPQWCLQQIHSNLLVNCR